MFRLIRYNIRNQMNRISTYVTPLIIFVIVMTIKGIMNIDSGLMNIFNNLGNEFFFMSRSFFFELAIFIGSLVFVGMVINNIYKGPKEDGSIMSIISMPMKRKDIIMGNLLSLGICIFTFGTTIFVLFGISTVLDSGSSTDKVLSSLSIYIGIVVIMLIFASIILLVGSFMNSKSLITFSIVTGAFVPMISIVISLTAEPEIKSADDYRYVNAEEFNNNKNVKELYLDMSKVVGETKQQQELASGKSDLYRSLSFIDPWYQLSGLFNIFNDDKHTHINWEQHLTNDKGNITLNGSKYIMISEVVEPTTLENDLHTISFNLANQDYVNAIKAQASRINSLTFEKQMNVMNHMLSGGTMSSAKNDIKGYIDSEIKLANDESIYWFHNHVGPTELMLLNKLVDLNVIQKSTSTNITPGISWDGENLSSYLIKNEQGIPTFIKADYINKNYLFIFWALVAIGFFGLTILVEFKRDIISK